MRCSNCGVCCTDTEMLLSQRDIARLVKMGFSRSNFVNIDEKAMLSLKTGKAIVSSTTEKNTM